MTLSDLFPRWYMSKSVLEPRRIRSSWKHFSGLHKLAPAKLTREAVEKERDRLLKTLSPSTVRRSLADIAVFAQWLVDNKHLKDLPTWKIPAETKPRQRWMTADEMKLLMQTARREDVPIWVDQAIHLCLLTGQRIGAILGLKWSQVSNGIIDFNEGVHERCKKRGVIPVTASIESILKECEGNETFVLGKVDYADFLAQWHRVCGLCGIKDATPHTMRHSVATNLIARGTPILEVSRMLGHSSTAITEKSYAKFAPDFTRRASDRMSEMLR